MSGTVLRFDPRRPNRGHGQCLCHGESYWSSSRGRRRADWLNQTALLSAHTLACLLAAVRARALSEKAEVPGWISSAQAPGVSLERTERWLEAVGAKLREPALGLHGLARVERGTGGLAELAAECADTLGDALLAFVSHVRLISQAASFHLHRQDAEAILVMRYRVRHSRVLRDFLAGYLALTVARWLDGGENLQLWFAGDRPTHSLAYRRALGEIAVGFQAPCDALAFPAVLLHRPMPRADSKLHDFLITIARHSSLRVPSFASQPG